MRTSCRVAGRPQEKFPSRASTDVLEKTFLCHLVALWSAKLASDLEFAGIEAGTRSLVGSKGQIHRSLRKQPPELCA